MQLDGSNSIRPSRTAANTGGSRQWHRPVILSQHHPQKVSPGHQPLVEILICVPLPWPLGVISVSIHVIVFSLGRWLVAPLPVAIGYLLSLTMDDGGCQLV